MSELFETKRRIKALYKYSSFPFLFSFILIYRGCDLVQGYRKWVCVHARQCAIKATQDFLWKVVAVSSVHSFSASHSPDLDHLDYSVWDILRELVCDGWRQPYANLHGLEKAVRLFTQCLYVCISLISGAGRLLTVLLHILLDRVRSVCSSSVH